MFTVYSQADYILYKGKIFTSDKKMLWAEAVAIKGERILAVGKNDDILKLKNEHTKLIDLNGRLVVPGFNDAHALSMIILALAAKPLTYSIRPGGFNNLMTGK